MRKGRKPLRAPGAKLIKRIVRQEFSRQVEDKTQRQSANLSLGSNPNTYLPFGTWDNNNVLDVNATLVNLITQGGSQSQRIGNRIKLKKLMLRGALYPISGITVPMVVKMWVVTDLLNPTSGTSTDIAVSQQTGGNWFEDGSGVAPLQNNLRDLQLTLNTSRYRVHTTRMFKVANSSAPSLATPPGNNDFKSLVNYKINLLKYVPKFVKYQDTSTSTTYQRKVMVCFQCVYANGVTSTDTTANIGHIRTIEAKWEDP